MNRKLIFYHEIKYVSFEFIIIKLSDLHFTEEVEEDLGDNQDIFSFLADPSDANKIFVSSLLEEKKTDGYQEGYEDGYREGRKYPTRGLSEWP